MDRLLIGFVVFLVWGMWFESRLALPQDGIAVSVLIIGMITMVAVWRRSQTWLVFFALLVISLGMFRYAISLTAVAVPGTLETLAPARVQGLLVDQQLTPNGSTLTIQVEHTDLPGSWASWHPILRVVSYEPTKVYYPGDRLELTGRLYTPAGPFNPGGFDYTAYLRARGISAGMVAQSGGLRLLATGGVAPARVFAWIRERLHTILGAGLELPIRGLYQSVVIGDTADLDDQIQQGYRDLGLTHILVVSGAQVGLVWLMIIGIGKLFRLDRRIRVIAAIAVVWIFALVVGGQASVVRAAVMITSAGLASCLGRKYTTGYGLIVAAVILVLLNPLILGDTGFQLSFMATAGIIWLSPVLQERWRSGPGWLVNALSVTVGAQLAILPLLLSNFNHLSWIGILVNLLALPLVGLVTALGLVAMLIGLIWPLAAMPLNACSGLLLTGLQDITEFFTGNWTGFNLADPPLWWVGIYYTLLVWWAGWIPLTILAPRQQPLRWSTIVLGTGLILSLLLFAATPETGLTVYVINVGEGNSILVRVPGGDYLIDGGGHPGGFQRGSDIGERIVVPFVRNLGLNGLTAILLTHPHSDHYQGLLAVARAFKTTTMYTSPVTVVDPVGLTWWKKAAQWVSRQVVLHAGQRLDWGGGVLCDVLAPREPLLQGTHSDLNNGSLVLRLSYGKNRILLEADAESEEEAEFTLDPQEVRADVLVVGHHGSKFSSVEGFLHWVSPHDAVISVGRNNYGHPAKATLSRLQEIGARIWRTDRQGAVKIVADGRQVRVAAFG